MKLVLIESSGKQETVQKYLGSDYKVVATKGHVRDLPVKTLGVDINKNFKPEYQLMTDKKKLVEDIKKKYKEMDGVLFATDPDREGEAIAWHLYHILGISPSEKNRIEFHEISKTAVQNALNEPRAIDLDLVDAQQARRVLDRLVGYKLSPIVCNKIQKNLSAGRVQSVTLRLVVDRDREIDAFVPEEYWTLSVIVKKDGEENQKFKANLVLNKKERIKDKQEMDELLTKLKSSNFIVKDIKRAEVKQHPQAPFTTSSMEQDALNKLGLTLKQTSAIAQTLYEGAEIAGEGKVPLITYIRTDSVRVSEGAQKMALDYINEHFGKEYAPKTPNEYKGKKNIQDAHEAIRPITLDRTPESLKGKMDTNQFKLYKMIYARFLASQMAEARYDGCTVEIDADGTTFKAVGKVLLFDGFTKLYENSAKEDDEEEQPSLPMVEVGDRLNVLEYKPEQKFTKPPTRFSEASLVKTMEDKGIGRPATYSPTVNTLLSRNYLVRDGKFLKSTELGQNVVDLLLRNFKDIMDVGFTAEMEDKLDTIEEGGQDWQKVIAEFYGGFSKELIEARKDSFKIETQVEESDVTCELCGSKMVYKVGKYGKFLACPNFPECKNTKPIVEVVCKCPDCGGDIVKRMSKKGKPFYGCNNYPKCNFALWDKPSEKPCPHCGSIMVHKIGDGGKSLQCTKCSFNEKQEDDSTPKE